jgi:hypothetical protein
MQEYRPIWVGLNNGTNKDLEANPDPIWKERAYEVDLQALALNPNHKCNDDPVYDQPFDHLKQGEKCWMARFDFSDHGNLNEWWTWFVTQPENAESLFRVVVGLANAGDESEPDWKQIAPPPTPNTDESDADGKSGADAETFCCRDFLYKDVQAIELFDLGVLFIHGIGNHKVRETLIRFGEPFVQFWEQWLKKTTLYAAERIPKEERENFSNKLNKGVLWSRHDNDAVTHWVDEFANAQVVDGAITYGADGIYCGGVSAEDTMFSSPCSDVASSTLLRFSLVRNDCALHESHILLSEAWWTEKTVYPSVKELIDWIWCVFPVIMQRHIFFTLSSGYDELCKGWRGGALLLSNVIRGIFNFLILFTKLLVWMPVLFVFGVLWQTVLLLLGLLGIVPIQWLRQLIGSFVDLLMGTVGQSYALKTSAIRRNAMVRAAARDLEWMATKCRRVAIISHSQGAEVARLLFQAQRYPKVCRWITFGAGIVQLNMLEEKCMNHPNVKFFAYFLKGCTIVTLALLALYAFDSVYGQIWPVLPWVQARFDKLITALPFFAEYPYIIAYILLLLMCSLALTIPPMTLRLRPSMMSKWRDYFASHDPVPTGSMFDRYKDEIEKKHIPMPVENRIFNTRFGLLDHTTYFKNWEQFVAPIALDLFELAGLGRCQDTSAQPLQRAAERRDRFTWLRMVLRFLFLIFFAIVLIYEVLRGNGHEWHDLAAAVWNHSQGLWPTLRAIWSSGLISKIMLDLKFPVVVAIVYLLVNIRYQYVEDRSKEHLVNDLAGVLLKERNPSVETPLI